MSCDTMALGNFDQSHVILGEIWNDENWIEGIIQTFPEMTLFQGEIS